LALAMIQKAVQSDPKNMAYRDSLGWVLFRLGRYEESAAELKAAAADKDADGVILDHLGEALQKAGDFAGATDAWTRAVQAFEKNEEREKAEKTKQKLNQAQAKTDKQK
jgi:tetratricopeptide (TPR) repeat protein